MVKDLEDDHLQPNITQLTEDTGCTLDELTTVMNERDGWNQCVNNCRACSSW